MLPTIFRTSRRSTPSVFDHFFANDFSPRVFNWDFESSPSPKVNVEESDKEFTIELAAPGFDKKDLKVNVEDDVLTISSEVEEKKEEKEDSFIRREFGFQSFKKSFRLPEHVSQEKISAKHENGILRVSIPKDEPAEKPVKKIKIA